VDHEVHGKVVSMLIVDSKALEAVRIVGKLMPVLRRRSKPLGDQLERALISVPLNLREGLHGLKGNRVARLHDAMGSAQEVMSCLEVAEALGYLNAGDTASAIGLLDEVCAMAWVLCYRPRR